MSITIFDFLFFLCALVVTERLYRKSLNRSNNPPGPTGLPVIGNLRDMPSTNACRVYKSWSREYGSDVIRLNVLGTNIIVVNSLEAATDLFDKRSKIYNDRPFMTMLNELIGFGWALSFVPYGDRWRDMRKAFHRDFSPEAVNRFNDIEVKASHELLRRLADRPAGFMDHARHMAGQIIMCAAYGIEIQSHDDPYIEIGEKSLHALSSATNAGSYLVDVLPFLKYLPTWAPGTDFKVQANSWKPWVDQMLNSPFEDVKRRMADGNARACAATALLEDLDKAHDKRYMESVIRATLGSMYAGGADTTVAALGTFILAMARHPDVQRKAQAELDFVIGNGRLPNFTDRPLVPYIDAIMKETLRWQPVLNLDIPHLVSQDDVYKGYFIPKGSLIIGNSWAILHDECAYAEPHQFNPDRFMRNGLLDPSVRDPDVGAFGFGRRICPGRFMAKESMWIAMAMILATMDIKAPMGKDGKPDMPSIDYEEGLVAYPKTFAVDIRVRSLEHEALISGALHS